MDKKEIQVKNDKSDYEVLILKRSSNISFASYYAFPGGNLEK